MTDCADCDAQVPVCPGPHWNDHAHTADPVCEHCRRRLLAALEVIPELYVACYLALPPGRRGSERVSGSRTPPLPLVAEADALMSTLLASVADWVEDVTEAGNLADATVRGRDGVILGRACATLSAHVDVLLALPSREHRVLDVDEMALSGADVWTFVERDGVDACRTIIDVAGLARSWLGQTRGRDHLDGVRCPSCDQQKLFRVHGSDTITCEECLGFWTREDLARWTAMLAGQIGPIRKPTVKTTGG